jgi:hypothetical protein
MRYSLVPLLIVLSAVLMQAQSGPCTEVAVKQGNLPSSVNEKLGAGREQSKRYSAHLSRPSSMLSSQNVPAEESARQGQKRFMDVGPLFIAHAQPAKLIEPRESSFDDPSPSA